MDTSISYVQEVEFERHCSELCFNCSLSLPHLAMLVQQSSLAGYMEYATRYFCQSCHIELTQLPTYNRYARDLYSMF